jgi:hypothetical protein
VKVRDLIKLIEDDGWYHAALTGAIGNINICANVGG